VSIEAMKQALEALEYFDSEYDVKDEIAALRAAIAEATEHGQEMKFKLGDTVRKVSGSQWKGKVVGTYSTELTPEGYAVESSTEKGSVQIYPAKALELVTSAVDDAMQQLTDVQQEMDCYGDGNVYRGQRSADSQIQTILVPPRREWAGLTDEEMRQAAQAMDAEPLAEGWKELIKFARAIEAKLREKNDDK